MNMSKNKGMFSDENFGGYLPARSYTYNFLSSAKAVYCIARRKMDEEEATIVAHRFVLKRGFQLFNRLYGEDMEYDDRLELHIVISDNMSAALCYESYQFENYLRKKLAKSIHRQVDLLASF